MPRVDHHLLSSWQRARLSLLPRRRETLDAQLYLAVNNLPHTYSTNQQLSLLSDLGKGAGWVAGAGWLALRGGGRGRRAALAAVGSMFVALAIVQGPAKAVFRRRRPFLRRLSVVVGPRPTDSSFPSGHSAGSFAAAAALATFYPKERPMLLGLASGVGFSRMYLGHHFPSDVLVGASMGWLIGKLGARLLRGEEAL